jgi:hypothetical protein
MAGTALFGSPTGRWTMPKPDAPTMSWANTFTLASAKTRKTALRIFLGLSGCSKRPGRFSGNADT